MIRYSEERFKDTYEELIPLFKERFEEVNPYPDKLKYNPNYDIYIFLETQGTLNLIVARDEGEIVGYALTLISPHLHASDSVYAINDLIHINPSHRKGKLIRNLLRTCEEVYREKGADVMLFTLKDKYVRKALGMTGAERVYSKYIGT